MYADPRKYVVALFIKLCSLFESNDWCFVYLIKIICESDQLSIIYLLND